MTTCNWATLTAAASVVLSKTVMGMSSAVRLRLSWSALLLKFSPSNAAPAMKTQSGGVSVTSKRKLPAASVVVVSVSVSSSSGVKARSSTSVSARAAPEEPLVTTPLMMPAAIGSVRATGSAKV